MSDDLGQIQQDIGKLLQGQETGQSQRKTMFERQDSMMEELVKLRQDHNALDNTVKEDIKPAVTEFRQLKQRGLGIAAGLVLATGSATAWISKVLHLPSQSP